MRSDIDQLRVFFKVVQLGSFTKAAEELYLTQPAVSAQVAKLERRLKVRLIDRLGRSVFPTEAGRALYAHADEVERLCSALQEAELALREAGDELAGKLAIGASTTISIYMLPPLLGEFKRRNPRVEFALDASISSQLMEQLLRNRYDFALLEGPVDGPGVEFEHFWYDELFLVVARDHPWAQGKDVVAIREVVGQPFISHRQGSGVQTAIQWEFQRHGVEMRPSMTIDNIEVVKKAVESGLGISILSRLVVQQEVEAGSLVIVPVRSAVFTREFRIATLKGKYLSPTARAFLSFFKGAVNERYPSASPGPRYAGE